MAGAKHVRASLQPDAARDSNECREQMRPLRHIPKRRCRRFKHSISPLIATSIFSLIGVDEFFSPVCFHCVIVPLYTVSAVRSCGVNVGKGLGAVCTSICFPLPRMIPIARRAIMARGCCSEDMNDSPGRRGFGLRVRADKLSEKAKRLHTLSLCSYFQIIRLCVCITGNLR